MIAGARNHRWLRWNNPQGTLVADARNQRFLRSVELAREQTQTSTYNVPDGAFAPMMAPRPANRLRSLLDCGFLVAPLAILAQLAIRAVALPDSDTADASRQLDAAGILRSDLPASRRGGTVPHHHHASDLALCPLKIALTAPAVMLTPAPVLPPPTALPLFLAGTASRPRTARGRRARPYPRGPAFLA